jgi:LemA protein
VDTILGFVGGLVELAIVLAVVIVIVAVFSYNRLRKLAENVKEAESNIDIAVRKKLSLVNQLVDVASKYADRESLVMLKVSQDAASEATPQLYRQSGTVLSTVQSLAQRFPELKSSEQYTHLAKAIDASENDVQKFRIACNKTIKDYNQQRGQFPTVLLAGFLGFRAARYVELDNIEAADASVQKQIISDDGDRLNELLSIAGTKMVGATRTLAGQGKLLAEKTAARVQQEIAVRSAAAAEYHYLDSARSPKGPVSRAQLDALFQSGGIAADTEILDPTSKAWMKYADLTNHGAQQ